MPQGLIALLPALITAGTAGTEIGLQASGALTPSTSGATRAANQTAQEQQKAAEAQAFKRFAPDVQENVGGSVSNPAFAQIVAELQGTPGDIGTAQQAIFGTNQGQPGTVFSPTTGGLASSVG